MEIVYSNLEFNILKYTHKNSGIDYLKFKLSSSGRSQQGTVGKQKHYSQSIYIGSVCIMNNKLYNEILNDFINFNLLIINLLLKMDEKSRLSNKFTEESKLKIN